MKLDELRENLSKLFFKDNVDNMLLYSLVDNEFYEFLCNLDVDNLRKMLISIYEEDERIVKSIREEKDEFRKYELMLRLENYFSLIELVTEKSHFSVNLINDFKDKYGNSYLNVIEDIDNGEYEILDTLVDKYLFIKEWQDKQNKFGRLVIEKLLDEVKYFYEDVKDYVFFKLREKKILDMDILSNLLTLLSKEDMLSLVGGKCYGLVKLYSKDINIPLTYCVLTDTNVSLDDIDFLDENSKYSVRSSATIEDGENHSFAGMFDTYLDVSKSEVVDKINEVKNSINSLQVKEYMKENNVSNVKMAVVIQKFVNVDYSGIWFGININEGIYEYINDMGEKLVSGSTSADRVRFKKGDAYTVNGINVGEVFVNIQNIFKEICDLEWCIIDGKLFLLQYRAVTKSVELFDINDEVEVNSGSIKGLGVSPGVIESDICYLESFDDELDFNGILLTTKTDVRWMGILKNVKGLITYKGSLLCHAAIIARELGIPCITDLSKEDYDKLKNAKVVRMNGKTGIIEIISK